MFDTDPIPDFPAGNLRIVGIVTETRILKWEPRDRRHHAGLNLTIGEQMPQAIFNKNAMTWSRGVRVQGTERQYLHLMLALTCPPLRIKASNISSDHNAALCSPRPDWCSLTKRST